MKIELKIKVPEKVERALELIEQIFEKDYSLKKVHVYLKGYEVTVIHDELLLLYIEIIRNKTELDILNTLISLQTNIIDFDILDINNIENKKKLLKLGYDKSALVFVFSTYTIV